MPPPFAAFLLYKTVAGPIFEENLEVNYVILLETGPVKNLLLT